MGYTILLRLMSEEDARRAFPVAPNGNVDIAEQGEKTDPQTAEEQAIYSFLLQERGEEYARLYREGRTEVERYVRWWQQHFSTENDKIKDLGLEPEYFSSLDDARKFLQEIGETPPPSMVVRKYRPDDTEDIVALFSETVRTINSAHYSEGQIEAWAPRNPDLESWSARFTRTFTAVADLSGKIVAFGNIEGCGHLDCLYVHHQHQGKGAATAVLEALESKVREAGKTRIVADVSITAREFFLKRGFVEIRKQEVLCRGKSFENYLMEKFLY